MSKKNAGGGRYIEYERLLYASTPPETRRLALAIYDPSLAAMQTFLTNYREAIKQQKFQAALNRFRTRGANAE